MIDGRIPRSAQLESLLDEAFELDPDARERFLETLEPGLRDELALLLKADAVPCPLDNGCAALVEADPSRRSTRFQVA